MIKVGAYATRSDAELAQAVLAAAGILSVLSADDAGGAYPFVLSGVAHLLVDETDADDAVAVLSGRPHQNETTNDDCGGTAAREQTRGFHGCDGKTR